MSGVKKENLYLIKVYDNRKSFYKIGVSVHKFSRFYQIMKHGYSIRIIYMIMGLEMGFAYNLEKFLQNHFRQFQYIPIKYFGGHLECFETVPMGRYMELIESNITGNYKVIEDTEITWR